MRPSTGNRCTFIILQGLALLLCWALQQLEGLDVSPPVDAACHAAIADSVGA